MEDTELLKILVKYYDEYKYMEDNYEGPDDWQYDALQNQTVASLKALIKRETDKARIDENESLLDVAQHEIDLGDKCYNHDKYTAACFGCRKRKMYVAYSEDWKRSITERLAQLKQQQGEGK